MRAQNVTLDGGEIVKRHIIPPGDTRCRCGKNGYTSRKGAAARAAAPRRESGGEPIYAYRCDQGGHCWHIGHNCARAGHELYGEPDEFGDHWCWCRAKRYTPDTLVTFHDPKSRRLTR